jgi:hypothetical protein
MNSDWPALSNDLLLAFIKAFGLEGKRVTAITLRLEYNKFAKLTIERMPLEKEAAALCEAIKDIKPDLARMITEEVIVPAVDANGNVFRAEPEKHPVILANCSVETTPETPAAYHDHRDQSGTWRTRKPLA